VGDAEVLRQLAVLPGVPDAVEAAREACTALRWHQALRRRTAEAAAETTVRAARASAALEGAELPVALVRDQLRGARPLPPDAVGATVAGALRATVEAGRLGEVTRRSPAQALARLHTAAAAGLVPEESLGRPRRRGEAPRDLGGPRRVAPPADEVAARLEALAGLLSAEGDVPALVLAAIAHGELLALRPFVAGNGVVAHNTYGERMRLNDGRVLPNFMYQALMGEPLTVYGDGKQTRSFQYVSDLVEGIWRLLRTDYHEPVNLGNPAEITILEFAEEIRALAGTTSQIVFKPLPQDDPKVRQPDISRAKALLGWEPQIDLREGLQKTIEDAMQKLARPA